MPWHIPSQTNLSMKKSYSSLIIIFLLSVICPAKTYCGGFDIKALQKSLDYAIEHRGDYEAVKLRRIDSLSHTGNYYALFEEYQSYMCDSALKYINLDIAATKGLIDRAPYHKAVIKKAQVLSVSGLYSEALDLLGGVQSAQLDSVNLTQYYKAYADLYLYMAEYAGETEFHAEYLKGMDTYQDSILHHGTDEFLRFTTEASRLMNVHKMAEAREVLEYHLKHTAPATREYAILTSTLSFVCGLLEDHDAETAYLIMSATADVEAVVKENKSLRGYAEILYQNGELKKADRYMQISMEDANFYNARLRNVQVSKMLPVINRAYKSVEERQKFLLICVVVLLSLFVVALVFVIRYVRIQNQKVTLARNQLQKVNNELTEANKIKETYLAQFLELCSVYIDNIENYRKKLHKKASSGRIEDVYSALKQNNITDEVLREFYSRFDEAFLNIYPDFVSKFNSLLQESERIVPKEKKKLTTELRIYALIRLGITDSTKIAEFVHHSLATVYTYRSRMKNKALDPDNFESEIMKF
ncbi:MAG: hypothetical protein J6P34_01200 [Paludibacteraceae bacterium]|nr:hypothetical protein [Paludibacteraceae bacterium]